MNVPLIPSWVHSLDDYKAMFDLGEQEMSSSILDYPAGVSSFNAQMHAMGYSMVSADANYSLSPEEMVKAVGVIKESLAKQLEDFGERLIDQNPKSRDDILSAWNQYVQQFLDDYPSGLQEGRYQAASLPRLPFDDGAFQLALCSDMLFREKEHPAQEIVSELCRVATEVRIFPLLDASGQISPEIGPIMLNLQQEDFGVEVRQVPYKLQKGSNAMLRVWVKSCTVAS